MTVQLIALSAAIAYAMSFILSKRGMRYSTPITITFVSLLMQTIVLLTIVFLFTGIPPTTPYVYSLFIALSFGPVVMVTPLTATLPLWVVIGSKLFLRDVEKITTRTVVGAILVVAGTIAITLAKP